MAFNPALPQTNAPIASAELRAQFTGLKDLIDALPLSDDMTNAIVAITAGSAAEVTRLNMPISNPPTQAQVTAVLDRLNELIDALRRD